MIRHLPILLFAACLLIGCSGDQAPMAGERPPIQGPEGHRVPPFGLTTQSGDTLTHQALKGKLHVADFFFTTCPTICPEMSKNMRRLQKRLKELGYSEDEIMLLSFSVDPEHDTPSVLRDYAKKYGADTDQWKFLTGDKEQIYELGEEGYMVTAKKDTGKEKKTRHLHSGYFLLVDEERRVRGHYLGTDSTQLDELIGDIRWLLEKGDSLQEGAEGPVSKQNP